jgi:hypothetical protein
MPRMLLNYAGSGAGNEASTSKVVSQSLQLYGFSNCSQQGPYISVFIHADMVRNMVREGKREGIYGG